MKAVSIPCCSVVRRVLEFSAQLLLPCVPNAAVITRLCTALCCTELHVRKMPDRDSIKATEEARAKGILCSTVHTAARAVAARLGANFAG